MFEAGLFFVNTKWRKARNFSIFNYLARSLLLFAFPDGNFPRGISKIPRRNHRRRQPSSKWTTPYDRSIERLSLNLRRL